MSNFTVADKIDELLVLLEDLQNSLIAQPIITTHVPPVGFVESEECAGWYDWTLEQIGTLVTTGLNIGYNPHAGNGKVYIAGVNSMQGKGEPCGGYFTADQIDKFVDALLDAKDAIA